MNNGTVFLTLNPGGGVQIMLDIGYGLGEAYYTDSIEVQYMHVMDIQWEHPLKMGM
jgi:hypothetical protein